jgi:hypothetical protein
MMQYQKKIIPLGERGIDRSDLKFELQRKSFFKG